MPDPRDHRVLIPIDVLEGQTVPATVIDAFASIPVVLLGYREIPDQTGPDQARDQYGDRMQAELAELRSVFEDVGCDVTTRSAFTHDRLKTFERVAVDASCDAVLVLNPAPILETVLVAIRSDVNVEYIAQLLETILAGTDLELTLFTSRRTRTVGRQARYCSRRRGRNWWPRASTTVGSTARSSSTTRRRRPSSRPQPITTSSSRAKAGRRSVASSFGIVPNGWPGGRSIRSSSFGEYLESQRDDETGNGETDG